MNTTELTHKNLIKKFHTLLSKYSIRNEDKMTILGTYGVETSLELTIDELAQLCDTIENTFGNSMIEKQQELDKLRKRLIAAIFSWRKSIGCAETDMNLIKAIACRAGDVPEGYALSIRFNTISAEKLRSLYNAFVHMAKDMKKVKELNQEMLDKLTLLN